MLHGRDRGRCPLASDRIAARRLSCLKGKLLRLDKLRAIEEGRGALLGFEDERFEYGLRSERVPSENGLGWTSYLVDKLLG